VPPLRRASRMDCDNAPMVAPDVLFGHVVSAQILRIGFAGCAICSSCAAVRDLYVTGTRALRPFLKSPDKAPEFTALIMSRICSVREMHSMKTIKLP